MPKKKATEPIYLTPFAEAVSLGEVKLYHASMAKNMDCAGAIDKAVNDCYKGGYVYDLKSAVQSVISEFGEERTKFVTALHLKRLSSDGRFSQENKAWAATLNVPHFDEFKYIHMKTHASILDGFTDHLRKITESQQQPKIGSYTIKKSVLFTNNRGFAFAESKTAVSPFVTWQFKIDSENNERDYYWGNYFSDKDSAIADYKRRIEKYKSDNNVKEIKETRTKKEITP